MRNRRCKSSSCNNSSNCWQAVYSPRARAMVKRKKKIGIKEDTTMKKNILSMAVLLMASAAVFTACSSDDNITGEQPANSVQKTYTMTVNATKGDDATTRALTLGRNDTDTKNVLNATWDANEVVLVYQGGSQIGTLHSAASATNETTLTGTLDSAPDAGQDLTLYFHTDATPSYTGQDGTLATIASTYDFCAPATITAGNFTVSGSTVSTTGSASFGANQQAIVKFTLIDKTDGTTSLSASQLVINDGTTDYTITPASATSVIYAAIPGFTGKTVTLTATVGGDTYTYEKASVSFTNGKYYEIGVKMTKQASTPTGAISGKFTINSSGDKVYFSQGNLQYTKSTGKWSFMTNQYSTVETHNQSVGTNYASQNVVSLFGWGTSGSAPSGQTARASYYTNANNDDYVSNITTTGVSWGTGSEWDWGTAAASDLGSGWRTLTKDEWVYLFNTRTVNNGQGSGKSYTLGQTVNDVLGVVLYPDDYTGTTYTTSSDWSTFESAGCVFLPAAGYRSGPWVYDVGSLGGYWSSTASSTSNAYYVRFISGTVDPANSRSRYSGYSVRLVRPVE